MLAIQACNLGQGIDENPVTVNKGVQFCFIRDDGSRNSSSSIEKVCYNSPISSSSSGNFGDFSQLKFNLLNTTEYIQILNQCSVFHNSIAP